MLADSPAQSSPKEWAKKTQNCTQTTEAECSVVHCMASHTGIRQVTVGLTAVWHHLASDCFVPFFLGFDFLLLPSICGPYKLVR